MKLVASVLCPLVLLLVVALCSTRASEILGKFVFHGSSEENSDNSVNILHKPTSIHLAPTPGPVRSDEVASILSLSLGASVPKDIEWSGLQVNNPFKLPKAAVMISVDHLPVGHGLQMHSEASYPLKNVGGDSLRDMYFVAPKYSLATHVSGIFEGKSNVVSISADEEVAGSGHTRSALTETSVWSTNTKSWKVVGGDGQVKTSFTHTQILKHLPQVLTSGFTYHKEDNAVIVNTKALECSFNLDDATDFKLFAELVYISQQIEELSSKKTLVRDNVPDLYLLSVSALRDIETKYGASSQQMRAAIVLIEKFIENTVKRFVDLYDGNVLAVGVAVASQSGLLEEHHDELEPVLKVLEEHKVAGHSSGSEIHLLDSLEAETQRKLCESVQGALGRLTNTIQFKCSQDVDTHHVVHKRSLLSTGMGSTGSDGSSKGIESRAAKQALNLGSEYNDDFPVIFNMWFWLIVILALTVYVVSIGMWNMDPGRDSIIYRLTQQKIKSD